MKLLGCCEKVTHYTVPEENRDFAGSNFCAAQFLRGTIFAQILPFRAKSQFFANFALERNFCANLRLAERNFFAKFANFAICAKIPIYVFPLKFAFSVLGWLAINFCANWAPYSYQCKIHLTHNTTDSMCFVQTLLIIQRTQLVWLPYCIS